MPLYAPFGNAIYGETLYGLPPVSTIAATFNIRPIGYDTLEVNWVLPIGPYNEIVLVRSSFGIPISVYAGDGLTLLDETSFFTSQYVDSGLKSGHFYYYSLFAFNTVLQEFVLAGFAQGLVISNWGFGETFESWTPDWYLEQDSALATDAQPDGPLVRYLNLLGYEMDWVRSEIESLFLLPNIELASGALLPAIGANYGVDFEPELGMTRTRVLVKNAVHLYKERGTNGGIASAASAFSGYGCEVTIGPNQEIQLDTAAFDQSIGWWVPGNASTVITFEAATKVPITPPYVLSNLPHSAWNPIVPLGNEIVTDGYLPVDNANVGVATASGQILFMTTCTPATAQTLGIPTDPGVIQVESIYIRPAQQTTPTLRAFTIQIDWYAGNGALISSTVGASITEISGQWVRAFVVGTAPTGAVTYGRTVKSTVSLSNDKHLFDALQCEINTQATPGPTPWQPPRDIQVNLLPIRQNLFKNPAGLSSLLEWSVTGGTFVPANTMATPPAVAWPADVLSGFVITAVPTVTATGQGAPFGDIFPGASFPGGGGFSGSGSVVTNVALAASIPVVAGESYTFSAYMQAALTGEPVTYSVTYFDAHGNLLSTAAFSSTIQQALTQGLMYNSLSVPPLPYALEAGETFLLNPNGLNPQLLQVSQAANVGDVVINVGQFTASDNYPFGTLFSFSFISFVDTPGVWTRGAAINVVAPTGAVSALIQVVIPSPAAGEIHYFAAPLFEPVSALLPYFDANFSPSIDYWFEGSPNQSVSDYYPAYPAKLSRLIDVLPDYVPIGATFSLNMGAQAFAAIAAGG